MTSYTHLIFGESHKYTAVGLFTVFFSTCVHVLLILLFVTWLDLGFFGVCLATSLSFASRFVMSFIYLNCWVKEFIETRYVPLFSRESISNLRPQFSRGAYSLMMGVWNWWAFDIFTLIASYLAADILSAQTIMRSLGLLTFMVPVGLGRACSFYIGIFIGRGCEDSIRHYYKIIMFMTVAVAIFQIILLWAIRDLIIAMYTDQEDIRVQMRYAWPIFLIFVFFDTT